MLMVFWIIMILPFDLMGYKHFTLQCISSDLEYQVVIGIMHFTQNKTNHSKKKRSAELFIEDQHYFYHTRKNTLFTLLE